MKQRNLQLIRVRGVTLIELMIVVVIISIISAIAYPSYLRQAHKAGRTDATSALLAIAAAQEKEFLKNNAYTDDLDVLGVPETDANKYALSVTLPGAGMFLAKAIPNVPDDQSQVGDVKCAQFTIDHTGAKRSSDADTNSTNGCW
ncbi:MAG: type IV pilin protein [Gammaproteobacteria bacterium]